ncbi:MAG TPA: ABC transporter substrate-binding protein [Dehalococcoidia bacterium]|nr:ABC transporter substrate-binding protein [Dehalococcoidia bacterium]
MASPVRRRVSRRRFIGASGAFSAAFLAACSGSNNNSGGQSKPSGGTGSAATAAPVTQVAVTAQPQAGRSLNRNAKITLTNGADIDSFDAVTGTGGDGQQFLWTVFDNLVSYDSGLKLQPSRSLAESWEYADPTILTFHLRKGVTFHDGTPFNAQAVRVNWQHVVNDGSRSGAPADLQAIGDVQTPDDATAIFKLQRPDGGLLTKLCDRPGFQSSPAALTKYGADFKSGEYKRNPVGTGAFSFDGWQSSSYVRVKRNPNYWQPDHPFVAGVEWKIIPDPNTALAAFQTGDLNLLWGIPPDSVAKAKAIPKTKFGQKPGVSIASFTLNTARPPFNNPHAGRALSFAIDRKQIIDGLLHGLARPAATWVGPGNAEYDPNYQGLWFDPARVKQELQQAGLPDGFKFLMTFSTSPVDLQLMQAIQAQIAQFGLKMDLQPDAAFTAKFQDDKLGDGFYSAYSGRAEPSQSFNFKDAAKSVYVSAGDKIADPEFEKMLADLESTLDAAQRKTKLYKLGDFINDHGWDVFLWHSDTLAIWNESVALDMFGDGKPHLGQGDVTVAG